MTRRRIALVATALSIAAGAGYPLIELALACREPIAESCVWGKAYLPLSLTLSLLIIGIPVWLLVYLGARWYSSRSSKH